MEVYSVFPFDRQAGDRVYHAVHMTSGSRRSIATCQTPGEAAYEAWHHYRRQWGSIKGVGDRRRFVLDPDRPGCMIRGLRD